MFRARLGIISLSWLIARTRPASEHSVRPQNQLTADDVAKILRKPLINHLVDWLGSSMLSGTVGAIIGVVGVLAAIFALLNEELNKTRSVKFAIVGVLFALAIYAMIGSIAALQGIESEGIKATASTTNDIPLAIDSTKDWQSTGIVVSRGDRVSIRVVSGKWTAGRYSLPQDDRAKISEVPQNAEIWVNSSLENAGGGGMSSCQTFGVSNCPVPSSNVGVLVGRISASEAFEIGNAQTFTAPANGILFLRINDGEKEGTRGLEDNYGILAVGITISK